MAVGMFLLRVMLCLGLLVDGSAHATTIGHALHARQQHSVATAPCHESHGTMAGMSHRHADPVDHVKRQSDCCKSGTCECACSQGAAASMPSLLAQAREVRHLAFIVLPVMGYASPALPRLNRPPIA